LKSVREMIYKRGYAKVRGQRIPITSNAIIEKKLCMYDMFCLMSRINCINLFRSHLLGLSRSEPG
jgi:large subunit ribosomal protein L7e